MKIAFAQYDAIPFDSEADALAFIEQNAPAGERVEPVRFNHYSEELRAKHGRYWWALAVFRSACGCGEQLVGYLSEDAPLGRYL